ncbi:MULTISPECIES: sporulation membrane protein YtaF [Lysinibacillus]|uniref:Sporulation membrane protein YtaF n=1 Tax=Lysinibacillus antri TaxID=2498145 RepID=A0A432LFY6_9BACI|nr:MULTISPECIES: sporulation membrane protein YtaF [Lysinibacillus]RUL56845.1 sporulation membrane protein YtaF [Lysinibacillus antri]TSI08664.1 sporulation membrane protein YtaF [Lysinibacillus sp. BW-2-10]
MGELLSLLLLGFVVSLDSFTVGLTYGMRKVTIPFKSLIIISTCTFLVLLLAMIIGTIIEQFISHEAAERLGGIILIGIGIWVLYQFFTSQKAKLEDQLDYKVIKFEIKSFAIIIKILKKPMEADFNRSGNINSMEALFLGLALSLDSFGAGVGAALIDLPPILFSIVITISCTIFVIAGIKIGKMLTNIEWMKNLTLLPGIALILIGIFKL